MQNSVDVIVVGAGHAGIEAALASARMGLNTVLFTMSLESVANMPCNPSIGGTAKGHLVYEIDALGGEMAYQADIATIQSRTLNTGKGAAVQSKRVQADRKLYQRSMKHVIEQTKNLRLIQAEVTELLTDNVNGKVAINGIRTKLDDIWNSKCVVLATGTYLDSSIFVGNITYQAGPDGFLPAIGLSKSLRDIGVKLLRFKTGTPARINKRSINYTVLDEQPGEEQPIPYSYKTKHIEQRANIPCYIVYTNQETHSIIKSNIKRSAMYSGNIKGTGPRYCPSIEDKLVRFADKERHQLFVEPMGLDTDEIYMQGFSTSMPLDVQTDMLHSLKGFENAEIMRYAYAIEYDCIDPTQMNASLEFKNIDGLFGAGQFNGTSGYEEAAAQGLIAGINAARKVQQKDPLILQRYDSYIGTLIDDLVTKGTNEPYRMMTSRSEYRLLLRQDNADFRLTKMGYDVGLVTDEQYNCFLERKERVESEKIRLENTYLAPTKINEKLEELGQSTVKSGISLADLLRRPGIEYSIIQDLSPSSVVLSARDIETIETDIKYEGYVKKELDEVNRTKKLEERPLPSNIDYSAIKGLRIEAIQKLAKVQPLTIGQASRISGVNPADIQVLLIYLNNCHE